MNLDKIIARGLTFQGSHGVLPAEKSNKQPFIVDLEIFKDLCPAGMSDNLEDTVSYAEVYAVVKRIVEQESYNLIETLAENIAAAILLRFPIKGINVRVYKPQAPVEGEFEYFAVEITRFNK